MNYFLVKADPDNDYSIDDLKHDGKTIWDGVHSNAAINFIKQMQPGDKVFFYHSQKEKSIVGLTEVVAMPFENKDDPRPSWAVEIAYIKHFQVAVTLDDIKSDIAFSDFALVRQSRLSVMPVPRSMAAKLLTMAGE